MASSPRSSSGVIIIITHQATIHINYCTQCAMEKLSQFQSERPKQIVIERDSIRETKRHNDIKSFCFSDIYSAEVIYN